MPDTKQIIAPRSYKLPLARKYRPQRFSDLIGQEFLSKALCNAIKLGREPHAVIFSGVRGIGKTTVARIYAKALNCEQRSPSGDACSQCESCRAVAQGSHEDVMEIDGASNTGIDDIRSLQESLDYIPIRSPYKVIIIDEVHSLSNSAFNALLKTLEEPPSHVVFAFATTEFDKIPKTIVSRCQSFFLKTFSDSAIVEHLKNVLDLEKIEYDEEALRAVARHGRGSMRDSLTHLDQVIAIGMGRASKEASASLYSEAAGEQIEALLSALIARDRRQVLQEFAELIECGVEVLKICESLSKLCRSIFVLNSLNQTGLGLPTQEAASKGSMQVFGLGLSDGEIERIYKMISEDNIDVRQFHRIFGWLSVCMRELDESYLDRFVFENYALQWCLDAHLPLLSELVTPSSQKKNAETLSPRPRAETSLREKLPLSQRAQQSAKIEGNSADQNKSARVTAPPLQAPEVTSRVPAKGQGQVRESLFDRIREQSSGDRASAVMDSMLGPTTIFSSMDSGTEPQIKQTVHEKSQVPSTSQNLGLSDRKIQSEPTLGNSMMNFEQLAGKSVENVAPKADTDTTKEIVESEDAPFPVTWTLMIERWKIQKPIRARIFEDSFSKEYSSKRIHIMVIKGSSAAQQVYSPQVYAQVKQDFESLFGFTGELIFSLVDEVERAKYMQPARPLEMEKTLLEKRDEAKIQQDEKTKKEILNHPITKLFVDKLGGRVDSISLGEE